MKKYLRLKPPFPIFPHDTLWYKVRNDFESGVFCVFAIRHNVSWKLYHLFQEPIMIPREIQ